jgi:hypothetical protein
MTASQLRILRGKREGRSWSTEWMDAGVEDSFGASPGHDSEVNSWVRELREFSSP